MWGELQLVLGLLFVIHMEMDVQGLGDLMTSHSYCLIVQFGIYSL